MVNPAGDVGIATLWSPVARVVKLLGELGIDLNPRTSRVAALGNLYGNGLPEMLRNLLWNPQIRFVVALGQNLSGSREELAGFFARGLEPAELLGSPLHRIVGTDRLIDGEVTPERFADSPSVAVLGALGDARTRQGLRRFFADLPAWRPCSLARTRAALPEVRFARYPSEPRGHTILHDRPLNAWEELVFRLVRFGHRNEGARSARASNSKTSR